MADFYCLIIAFAENLTMYKEKFVDLNLILFDFCLTRRDFFC